MWENFSVINNLAVITPMAVDYSRMDVFHKGNFESEQVIKSTNGSKNNINITK